MGGGISARRFMHPGSPLVFLANLFNKTAGHEVLELFISAQTEHFLPAAHGIPQLEICKNPLEQVVETENFLFRKDTAKLISDMVRKAA